MNTATRLLLVALLLLALPIVAAAQAPITRGPVPAGAKAVWTLPANVPTVAEALTFEPRFYRSGVPLTALTSVTCVPATPTTLLTCQSVISASNLDAINMVGVHQLTLSLFRADVGEGLPSSPFVLTSAAGAPPTLLLIP